MPSSRVVLGLALLGLLHQRPAQAQQDLFAPATFAPLPTVIDYARYYTRVEECLVAFDRVRDSTWWGEIPPWGKTDHLSLTQPAPTAAVATTQRCAAGLPPTALAADPLILEQRLWLRTEQASLAMAVLARRLAKLPAMPARARSQILLDAISFAVSMRPARVPWAEQRLHDLSSLGNATRLDRLRAYRHLLTYAAAAYDTTRLDRYAAASLALMDSISSMEPSERAEVQAIRRAAVGYQTLRAMARGEAVTRPNQPIVPALTGDLWFRRPDTTVARPTPGKLGLVAFVDAECHCFEAGQYALLRALHEQFADALEITLATHTHGYFRDHPPLAPAEEAEVLRQYFLEHIKLPGTLVVETTPFYHRSAPDRRRVDLEPLNVEAYWKRTSYALADEFNPAFSSREAHTGFLHRIPAVLVDGSGRILMAKNIDFGDRLVLSAAVAGWLARSVPKS